MKDIAARAGVSLGTVSNVLSGAAIVREPLRKRVMEAIAAAGYQPSQLARGLRRVRTNMIGMIIPDVTNPFFPAVVRGAEDVAFANGYRLILCNTDNDHAKELAHLNELRTYLPAGLLVIPSNFSQLTQQVESYRASGAAVVCIDRTPRNWSGDTVTVANEEGSFQATEYLLRLGHTRLAVIIGPLHLTNSRERLNGFRKAMKRAKIEVPDQFIIETSYNQASGRTAGGALLKMTSRPTGVLAGNDLIAFGVMQAVREAGLRCPEDISIFGFDNLDMAELTHPALSSVYQPGYQLGTTAAQILVDRVGGDQSPARHIVLGTELRIRGSVGAPPSRPPALEKSRWGIGYGRNGKRGKAGAVASGRGSRSR